MARGVNAESIFAKTVSSSGTYYLPNDTDHGVAHYDVRTLDSAVVKFVNGVGASTTVTAEATTQDDPDFTEGVEVNSKSASSSGGTVGFEIEAGWSYIRVKAEPGTLSGSGDLKAVFNADNDG